MRSLFPYLALALLLAATGWAVSFGSNEPADFTFCNATEIKSVDPAIVTGQPEGRIIRAILEGLVKWHPQTLEPMPGVAENVVWNDKANRWDCVSDDGLVYTFKLRRDALWSNGEPVTSGDFVYSYRRFLNPTIKNQYATLLYYVVNGEKYHRPSLLKPGDRVEVELKRDGENSLSGRSGPVLKGKLVALQQHDGNRLYVVDVDGKRERFQIDAAADSGARDCQLVLLDFDEVGIHALDDRTLRITLKHRTPYFLSLLGFYPLFPVNQRCVETYGYPVWTRPENIVTNGPYLLHTRRIRDRIRLVKNPKYWNRENVRLDVIDALAVESYVTMLNMYEAGQVDWIPAVPQAMVEELLARERRRPPGAVREFNPAPMLQVYFYLVNVKRPPLNDYRVRQALSLALDRQEIVETATKAGEVAAHSLVPPGIEGYEQATCARAM